MSIHGTNIITKHFMSELCVSYFSIHRLYLYIRDMLYLVKLSIVIFLGLNIRI